MARPPPLDYLSSDTSHISLSLFPISSALSPHFPSLPSIRNVQIDHSQSLSQFEETVDTLKLDLDASIEQLQGPLSLNLLDVPIAMAVTRLLKSNIKSFRDLTQILIQLRQTLALSTQIVSDFEKQGQEIVEKWNQAETVSQTADASKNKAVKEAESWKSQYDALKLQHQQVETELLLLKTNYSHLSKDHDRVMTTWTEKEANWTRKQASLEQRHQELNVELQVMKQHVKHLESLQKTLETDKTELKEENQFMKRNHASLMEQIQQQLNQANNDNFKLKQQVLEERHQHATQLESMKLELTSLKSSLHSHLEKEKNLEQEKKQLLLQIENQSQQHKRVLEAHKEETVDRQVTHQEYKELELKCKQLESRLHQMTLESSTITTKYEATRELLQQSSASDSESRQIKQDMQEKLVKTQGELNRLKHIHSVHLELAAKDREKLTKDMDKQKETISQLEMEVVKLKQSLESTKMEHQSQVAHLSKTFTEVTLENQQLQDKMKLLNEEYVKVKRLSAIHLELMTKENDKLLMELKQTAHQVDVLEKANERQHQELSTSLADKRTASQLSLNYSTEKTSLQYQNQHLEEKVKWTQQELQRVKLLSAMHLELAARDKNRLEQELNIRIQGLQDQIKQQEALKQSLQQEMELQLSQKQAKVDDLTKQVNTATLRLQNEINVVESLQFERNQNSELITRIKQQLVEAESVKKTMESLEKDLAAKNTHMNELQTRLIEKQTALEQLEQTHSSFIASSTPTVTLEATLLSNEIISLKQQLAKTQAQLALEQSRHEKHLMELNLNLQLLDHVQLVMERAETVRDEYDIAKVLIDKIESVVQEYEHEKRVTGTIIDMAQEMCETLVQKDSLFTPTSTEKHLMELNLNLQLLDHVQLIMERAETVRDEYNIAKVLIDKIESVVQEYEHEKRVTDTIIDMAQEMCENLVEKDPLFTPTSTTDIPMIHIVPNKPSQDDMIESMRAQMGLNDILHFTYSTESQLASESSSLTSLESHSMTSITSNSHHPMTSQVSLGVSTSQESLGVSESESQDASLLDLDKKSLTVDTLSTRKDIIRSQILDDATPQTRGVGSNPDIRISSFRHAWEWGHWVGESLDSLKRRDMTGLTQKLTDIHQHRHEALDSIKSHVEQVVHSTIDRVVPSPVRGATQAYYYYYSR